VRCADSSSTGQPPCSQRHPSARISDGSDRHVGHEFALARGILIVDTVEPVVDRTLEESDPLGSFPAEERPSALVSADRIVALRPAVAEVTTIRPMRRLRPRLKRPGIRARLQTRIKRLDATLRARWTRSRNWNSSPRLKTQHLRREVSRWTIRFSLFGAGVVVGVLTASPVSESNTTRPVTPRSGPESPAVRTTAGGTSPEAVGTALVAPPPSPVPTPAATPTTAPVPPRAAGHRGTLIVNSQPRGASVFVNNRLAGQTPLVMNALPAGSRAVRLSLDGYAAWSRGVSVVANQSTTITAKLETIR